MAAGDLCDLESVKAWGSIETDADDAGLSAAISAYSAAIKQALNRDISQADYDQTFNGRGTVELYLPQYPISAVALLQVNGLTIAARSAPSRPGYAFDDIAIYLDGGQCFPRGPQNIRVQWTAGYAVPPADLAQACIELVLARYELRDKLGWSSKSLAGETVSLSQKDMPAIVATTLRQWRKVIPV